MADVSAILGEAAEQLEVRFREIQDQLAPLREEQREVADAIRRLRGSYPAGFSNGTSQRLPASVSGRDRRAPAEREDQVLEVIRAQPEGINGKQIGEQLGLSTGTVTKAVNALLESGRIQARGERRARKLFLA